MEILKTSVKSLGIIVLAIILTGCIIRAWRVSPSETEGSKISPYPSQKESVIYFNVPQLFEEDSSVRDRGDDPVSPRVFATMLEHTLIENPTFGKAVLTSAPPQKGFYSSITVRREYHFTPSSILYLLLSACTILLVPYSTDDAVDFVISYELYQNGEPVKMYLHRVQQKKLVWALLPLAVPFMQDSWQAPPWVGIKEVAFADTARLFWLDAHRDGFF